MLAEFFASITSRAIKNPEAWTYKKESALTWSRGRRSIKAWEPHLKNCHAILENIKAQAQGDIWILGSGYGLDWNLKTMLEGDHKLHLVDIVQPLKLRLRAKQNSRLLLHSIDLAFLDWQKFPEKLEFLQAFNLPIREQDTVISLNLISQLPIVPIRACLKTRKLDNSDISALAKKIQKNHWQWFKNLKTSEKYVITDYLIEEHEPDTQTTTQTISNFLEFNDCQKLGDWRWDLAPQGELYKDKSVSLKVASYKCTT